MYRNGLSFNIHHELSSYERMSMAFVILKNAVFGGGDIVQATKDFQDASDAFQSTVEGEA